MAVNDIYDTFFINNEKEFSYVGCSDKQTLEKLRKAIATAIELLAKRTMANI